MSTPSLPFAPAADVAAHTATIDAERIAHDLRYHEVSDVLVDGASRAAYSTDASLYRMMPRAIVRPRHTDDVIETLAVARSLGVPITPRGAGKSCLGNAVGQGIVVDFPRHMNQVLDVDVAAGLAVVEPGVVHQSLQRLVMPHDVRFGPTRHRTPAAPWAA